MPRTLVAALALFSFSTTVLADDGLVAASGRNGAPVASDPTLSFAIATVALCVALYLVHRMVNRKVR